MAPTLASTECYALFSTNGAVANTGVTHVRGDVGTNVGLTIGFDPLLVTGTIHPIPDASTAQCAADLLNVYNYLNTLPVDIELLYPAQFGNSLVLTPHTYLLDAAAVLNDTLYLNALGNPDAVFVIKINGALSASSYSKVKLINGAQAKNVYWKIEGAVNINSYAVFAGTIVCNNGAMGALATGVVLNGRALTTTGALSTASVTVTMPTTCCVIPANIQVTGVVGQGVIECENALQTISVAGNGTTYQVLNGASVTMIAGLNIRFLSGARVYPGGYLHAYITPNGQYCCSLFPGRMMTGVEISESLPDFTDNNFFKVYPNPTSDKLYIEMDPTIINQKTEIGIFNMMGELIESKEVTGINGYSFFLGKFAPGIYLLQVNSGDRMETKKIIRK
jgi:hypothetical protein